MFILNLIPKNDVPISSSRFILHAKKTAFIVEHDFIMATYLADRVIVFDGEPSVNTKANRYVSYTFKLDKTISLHLYLA